MICSSWHRPLLTVREQRNYRQALQIEETFGHRTIVSSFFEYLGITSLTGDSSKYRWQEVQKIAQELSIDPKQEFNSEIILEWTDLAANLYSKAFKGIERDEIQNEMYIVIADILDRGVTDQSSFITAIHKHIEKIRRERVIEMYQNQSFFSSIRTKSRGKYDEYFFDKEWFRETMQDKLNNSLSSKDF